MVSGKRNVDVEFQYTQEGKGRGPLMVYDLLVKEAEPMEQIIARAADRVVDFFLPWLVNLDGGTGLLEQQRCSGGFVPDDLATRIDPGWVHGAIVCVSPVLSKVDPQTTQVAVRQHFKIDKMKARIIPCKKK